MGLYFNAIICRVIHKLKQPILSNGLADLWAAPVKAHLVTGLSHARSAIASTGLLLFKPIRDLMSSV